MIGRLAARLWDSPWPVLAAANLLWAGNIVLARGIAGLVPPVALAYWRWTGAFLVSLPFAWPHLRRDAATLRARWRICSSCFREPLFATLPSMPAWSAVCSILGAKPARDRRAVP